MLQLALTPHRKRLTMLWSRYLIGNVNSVRRGLMSRRMGCRKTPTNLSTTASLDIADSTRQCNFTHGMMREAAMPKCFSPSKVKEHECAPITASLRVSVTKFMH